MKTLIISLIVFWNQLLAHIGRALGMFFGGLLIGWQKGTQDVLDGRKYLLYKRYEYAKKLKELEENEKEDK